MSNFIKIRPVGAELLHADGQTDRVTTKLTVAFCNFANMHKKHCVCFTKSQMEDEINLEKQTKE